jgi:hypothetical protein
MSRTSNNERKLFDFILTLKFNTKEVVGKTYIYPVLMNDDIPNEQKRRLMNSDCPERGAAK